MSATSTFLDRLDAKVTQQLNSQRVGYILGAGASYLNGKGYPLGLEREDIPLEGRITAVADVFDALSSRRPYKPPFPIAKCFEIIEEERGEHFDPAIVDVRLGAPRVGLCVVARPRRTRVPITWPSPRGCAGESGCTPPR